MAAINQRLINKRSGLILVIGLLLLGGLFWGRAHSAHRARSARPNTKTSRLIRQSIQKNLRHHGFNGNVTVLSYQSRGFTPGGYTTKIQYQESVAGHPVRTTFKTWSMEPDEFTFRNGNNEPYQDVQAVRLQQPDARNVTAHVQRTFKPLAHDALKYAQTEIDMQPDMWTDNASSENWLKQRTAANRASSSKQRRAFQGYYDIPFKELLAHGVAYYRVTYNYHVRKETTDTDARGQRALKQALDHGDFKDLPDGVYEVGFDVLTLLGDQYSSAGNVRFMRLKNGQVSYPRN